MTTADLTAQIAARTNAAITEARDQLANGWTDHEVLVVAADAWAVIADLKNQLPTCTRCDRPITGQPLTDAEQVAWLGTTKAATWCSLECRDADAEDYWDSRQQVSA